MSLEPVHNKNKRQAISQIMRIVGLSLVETLVSIAIVALLFLMIVQSFNAIIIGSYMVDARTAVRSEGEFVSEFFKLYAQNADPNTVTCNKTDVDSPPFPRKSITWQPLGSGDTFVFRHEYTDVAAGTGRLVFEQKAVGSGTPKRSVLTYNDVNVKNMQVLCDSIVDDFSGQTITTLSIQFQMDSSLYLGGRPAVQNVQRYVTVTIK